MQKNRIYQFLYLAIFLISCGLRLALVAFNREANDPHEQVAKLILQSNQLPLKNDCWECFQPKLYHYVFAKTLQVLQLENNPGYQQNLVGEAINFFAGIMCLVVVGLFVKNAPFKEERLKLLAFGLVALNPALIGISSQATNDSFVILFSSLALYFTYKYFRQQKLTLLIPILVFVLLGISSKTNGWVTVIAISMAFLIKAWVENERRTHHLLLAIGFPIVVILLSILNPLNQYIVNYKQFGSPILVNIDQKPLPPFLGMTPAGQSGIWYIQDGFFTFKFVDLIQHPRIEYPPRNIPPFQGSFWTLIYGRANSVFFDNSVPSWSTSGTALFPLAQGIFILALLPTLLLSIGTALETYWMLKSVIKRDPVSAGKTSFGLFVIAFLGYVFFEILYTLEYRSLTVIKPIFIYPALLSFPWLFLRIGDKLSAYLTKGKRWLIYLFEGACAVLFILYITDVSTLIVQLGRVYLQKHGL